MAFSDLYVSVPKDMSKIKTKIAFNLTKRQLICFGIAGGLGLPAYFFVKPALGTQVASLLMMAIMLPCFLLAMYEKNGQPLEKLLLNIYHVRFRPRRRPFRTDNYYSVLMRQDQLIKEVNAIVQNSNSRQKGASEKKPSPQPGKKANAQGTKRHSGPYIKGKAKAQAGT